MELSEYQECCLLAQYLDILQQKGKVVLYTHIPNETYTKSWSAKMKNKKMGVNKGFPDYVILGKGKMLFIEMKRKKLGVVSPEQKLWLEALRPNAYVCRGFESAKAIIDNEL